jgi:hypothetical protein
MNKAPLALRTILLTTIFTLLLSPSVVAQQGRDLQLSQTASQSNGKRIALVIGNGAYTSSPLNNPPNDATDMARALSNVGFTVEHGVDLTQRQMKAMIRKFGQELKNGGHGLFYFAGHGIQLKGRNYLIPVDAEIASETDVEDQGVDANLIMGLMDEAGNGLNVVILDACRNNPFARSFRSTTNGLAQVDAPTGTLVAYSTAPGKVARDGTGRNGAYTAELLKQMSVPGVPIEEVMKRVRASLKQLTNGEQVPWESSSLVGAFYLNSAGGTASAADNPVSAIPSSPTVDSATIELAYWDTIKNSTDQNDFKSYLKEYPFGRFVSLAKNRISKLEESAAKPSPSIATSAPAAFNFKGWGLLVLYRNKEGVNREADANKIGERLRGFGGTVRVIANNRKSHKGIVEYLKDDESNVAAQVAKSIEDLEPFTPKKISWSMGLERGTIYIYVQ